MKIRDLVAEDLWPLVNKLSPSERMRLARMALESSEERTATADPYPLRGQPIRFVDPTEPAAEEDWSALR